MQDSFPGSGDKYVPLDPDTWMIITDGMAAATTTGTAAAAHLEGVDFAGKTGTAQVVGSGDTHTKGGAKTPNSWFVGMVPRRNPEIVIAVLQEHGDWGCELGPHRRPDCHRLREQEAHAGPQRPGPGRHRQAG